MLLVYCICVFFYPKSGPQKPAPATCLFYFYFLKYGTQCITYVLLLDLNTIKEIKFVKKILQFIKCGFRFQDVRGFS